MGILEMLRRVLSVLGVLHRVLREGAARGYEG